MGRLRSLDGLRGIAVLLVIAVHAHLCSTGFVGVDVFFVLSGFLITLLLCNEIENTGRLALGRFWQRRALRLLPALLIAVGLFALLQTTITPFVQQWSMREVGLASLLFSMNWTLLAHPLAASGPLGVTWSLGQEAQFYLAWPLVLALLLRLKSVRARLFATAATMAVLILLGALLTGMTRASVYYNPAFRMVELLFGGLLAMVWRNGAKIPAWCEVCGLAWIAAAIGLGFVVTPAVSAQAPLYLGTALFAGLLLLGMADHPASPIARVLASRPLRYIGCISYGVYMYHSILIDLLARYMAGPEWLRVLLDFFVPLAPAAVSWHLIESRVLRRRSVFGATGNAAEREVKMEPASFTLSSPSQTT